MRVVRLSDHKVVPWKNGRGSTTEIAISPVGATMAGGFDWRVSMAAVTEDGPFSAFPGIDRTLVLLEGDGLDLDTPSGTISLTSRYAIARFDGGSPVTGRLRGGPARDLNVMVRREALSHHADVVRVRGAVAVGDPLLVVALEGSVTVGGVPLAPFELAVGERAVLDGDGVALVVTLSRA